MESRVTFRIAISLFLTVSFLSCVGQQSGGGGQQAPADGKLYISNFGDSSLLTYGNASSANGNQTPTQNIQDLNVQSFIFNPLALFVDTINDRLYVANTGLNQILIYDNASSNTTTGNVVPSRVISGVATTLNAPRGLTVDTTRNILYVSNAGGNTILAFDVSNAAFPPPPSPDCIVNGSTTTCNFIPTRTVTGLTQPWGLFVDATPNDRLYVANAGGNSILVFNNASTINGSTLPNRTITFSNNNTTLPIPRLSGPSGIFVDLINDRLYVANGNDSILIFSNAGSPATTGEVVPTRAISGGQTNLSSPIGLFVDTTLNILYVTGNTTILSFIVSDAAFTAPLPVCTISGGSSVCNFIPTGTLSGAATTLSNPGGIFVDVIANVLYAANSGNNSFVVFYSASTATGNIAPSRTISDAGVPLSFPGGVAVDDVRDLLYAGKSGSIVIFENASAMQNIPVTQTFTVSPSLIFPFAIAVDGTRDRLYAASINSILIFNNASTLTGSPPPDDTIAGLTVPVGLSVDSSRDLLYVAESGTSSVKIYSQASISPTLSNTIGPNLVGLRAITVDSTRNILYVALGNSILVFDAASAANGTISPNRTITGGLTLLNAPQGIFVDSSNNLLYVANSGANSVLVFNNASTATGNIAPNRAIAQGIDPVNETTLNVPLGIFVDTTR